MLLNSPNSFYTKKPSEFQFSIVRHCPPFCLKLSDFEDSKYAIQPAPRRDTSSFPMSLMSITNDKICPDEIL